MSTISFLEYAAEIRELLDEALAANDIASFEIQVDPRSTLRGLVAGCLLFHNATELHFREFVDLTYIEPRLMYVYHYQDSTGSLIFRYDNAEHRPKLPQAEHRHTSDGVTVSVAPTLSQVLNEILISKDCQ